MHAYSSMKTSSTIVVAFAAATLGLIVFGCNSNVQNTADEQQRITAVLDSFHLAAAEADFDRYFGFLTQDAVFIGTDATERWDKKSFMDFSKPYFDRGRAWSFSASERPIEIDARGELAWFDELLDTQMKLCRGSGIMVKQNSGWKIRHYVLSMTIPNALTDTVVSMKAAIETGLIGQRQAPPAKR